MRKSSTKEARLEAFRARLAELGYRSYRDYLAGEHWQDVRARYRASKLSKNGCCAGCGSRTGLALHHRTYKRLGAERLTDLILVCGACHTDIHDFEDRVGAHPWSATNKTLRRARKTNGLTWRDVS